MNRDQVIEEYSEIIQSNRISKFEELVNLLKRGLGDTIYEDLKVPNHDIFNILRGLSMSFPRETFYVWQQFYNYLTDREFINEDRIELGTLYFYMGEALYIQAKRGFGKYYLKAYAEDIGFHTNYLNGGAIQALRVYCYLGQKGIELLDRMLLNSTSTRNIYELREFIRNTTRGDFERLTIKIENEYSLEGNEYFFLPLSALKEMISKLDPLITKKGNTQKSKILEQLCQLLFGSVTGFRFKFDERSALFQLDGLIQNTSDHPFLKDLGSTITVEAKQYFNRSRIDRKFIDILAMNMTRVDATTGFLVTTARLSNPAKKEIYHNYLRTGKFIIHFSYQDIKDLCNGRMSFPVLVSSKLSALKSFRQQ